MEGMKITGVELTQEAVHRIFETAIDAGHTYGFGYWADIKWAEMKVVHQIEPEGADPQIVGIVLHERDEPHRKMSLDKATLEAGIAKMLSAGCSLDDDLDGPTAELILQYAMFGEQVYG